MYHTKMESDTAPYNKDEIADLVSDEFDWDMYPYVVMTIDTEWDLSILDGEFTLLGNEEFLYTYEFSNQSNFDAFRTYQCGFCSVFYF